MRKDCRMIKFSLRASTGPHLVRDRSGVVAMWVAVTTPVVAMALGFGVDVTEWVIANQQLQRAADAAATAGSIKYGLLSGNAQQTAGIAADVAEANGITGTSTRSWTAGTKTLLDNNVTIVVGSAVSGGDNASVAVSVKRVVAPTFSKVFTSNSRTITASATADSIGGGTVTTYQQPCLFGLGQQGSSVAQITASGGVTVTLTGCSVQSNEAIITGGGVTMSASTFYASQSITAGGGSIFNGAIQANQGTAVADPYANNSTLNAAFGQLASTANQGTVNVSGGNTPLSPGIYPASGWTVGGVGTLTLSPGLYVVKGPINIGASGVLTGTGVTIVNNGSIAFSGAAVITLSAPMSNSATANAVPGVVLANNVNNTATSTMTGLISGGATATLNGVLYFPKSNFGTSGGTVATGGGSSGCLVIIANLISFSGGAALSNNGCVAMGVAPIGAGPSITAGSAKLLF